MKGNHKRCIERLSEVEDRAHQLDLRRQRQLANQTEVINRLLAADRKAGEEATRIISEMVGQLAHLYQSVERIHEPTNVKLRSATETEFRKEVHCRTCHGKVWPCETAQLFGIGSVFSSDSDDDPTHPNPG